jgi:hypothetical protein
VNKGELKILDAKIQHHVLSFQVKNLSVQCFQKCKQLQIIFLQESLQYIGYSCFDVCYSLKSITIPSTVLPPGANCFEGYKQLESINHLNEGLESLALGCFEEYLSF